MLAKRATETPYKGTALHTLVLAIDDLDMARGYADALGLANCPMLTIFAVGCEKGRIGCPLTLWAIHCGHDLATLVNTVAKWGHF